MSVHHHLLLCKDESLQPRSEENLKWKSKIQNHHKTMPKIFNIYPYTLHWQHLSTLFADVTLTVSTSLPTELKVGFHSASDRTGLFSILYHPHRRTKNVELLYYPGCGSQIQTGTENWYRKPMRGFNFVPIQSHPMLVFLSEKQP